MTDQEKKDFVEQQMVSYWTFVNKQMDAYNAREMHDVTNGSWNDGKTIPHSIQDYTKTFMEHLAFLMRVL